MATISINSNNKIHIIKLIKFYKILEDKIKIKPILYGSLAYFIYTKDNTIKINDLDFLIRENAFKKIIKFLEKSKIKYHYSKEWHTLQVFKGKLKIEFDSIDFWQKNLSIKFQTVTINNAPIKVITLNNLIAIYKKASKVSKDKPKQNMNKYLKLKLCQ
ncbi:MAG: hypothetical protein Q7R87_03765 [Nanoarchaeota archaeon]|nr:hypothetical protein [Nanoarchaeota archaeon]